MASPSPAAPAASIPTARPDDPNDDTTEGGGIFTLGVDGLTIAHCNITRNTADQAAGLLIFDAADLHVSHTTIHANTAQDYGGGLYALDCNDVFLENCLVAGNRAGFAAGLYIVGNPRLYMDFCTLSDNIAAADGGLALQDSHAAVENTILYHNVPTQIDTHGDSSAVLAYCDIEGSYPVGPDTYAGLGNLHDDPCFVKRGNWHDPATPSEPDDDDWVSGNYRLQSQAMTRESVPLGGDINLDGYVDLDDFADLANAWLAEGSALGADVSGNGVVDTIDLAMFAGDFLAGDGSGAWSSDLATSPCIDAGNPGCDASGEDHDVELCTGQNVRVNMGCYGNTSEAGPCADGLGGFGGPQQ